MVGLYLQHMHPDNATDVSTMVHTASDGEKKWLVEPRGPKRRLANKGVVNVYTRPRVYRLQDKEPISEKKSVTAIYGMLDAQGLSNIPEVVETRGTSQKNIKTVGKLILKSEYKVGNTIELNPFTRVHQEGTKVVLEGIRAEAMYGSATNLGTKFREWWGETEVFLRKVKEARRSPVKIVGTNVDHYQGMPDEEILKLYNAIYQKC